MRYLNESNYEEAILAFTQAIEIDPKNVEGYLGRAEACVSARQTKRGTCVSKYHAALQGLVDTRLIQTPSQKTLKEAQIGVIVLESNGDFRG